MNVQSEVKTLIIDLGTTGIVYTIAEDPQKVVKTLQWNYNGIVQEKQPTTFYIYSNSEEDIFEQSTILERAYFGLDEKPPYITQYQTNNPGGKFYTFHGLKQPVYLMKHQTQSSDNNKTLFTTDKVFQSLLYLLYDNIKDDIGDKYRIIFMAPANANPEIKTYLIKMLKSIFKGVQDDNSIIVVKEPIAASIFAVKQLQMQGVQLQVHDKNNFSRILILDLGGGTCDFNIVEYMLNSDQHQQLTNMAISVGGSNIDILYMNLIQNILIGLEGADYIKILAQFIKEKVKDDIDFYIDIPENIKIEFKDKNVIDLFGTQMQSIQEDSAIRITAEVIQNLSKKIINDIANDVKKFLEKSKDKGIIDHVLFVGGFSNYKPLTELLQNCILEFCKQFFNKEPIFNNIMHRSLAILEGGAMQYRDGQIKFEVEVPIHSPDTKPDQDHPAEPQINDHIDETIIKQPNLITVDQNVWFINNDERIQLFSIGQGFTSQDKLIAQLDNVAVDDKNVSKVVAKFEFQNQGEDVKQLHFEFDYNKNSPFQVKLSIQNGYKLSIKDNLGNKYQYDPTLMGDKDLKKLVQEIQQKTVYILIDCTNSMQDYILKLEENLQALSDTCKEQKWQMQLLSYSDFVYTKDVNVSQVTDEISKQQEFLQKCRADIEHQQKLLNEQHIQNDMTENMLSAFNWLLDKKINQQESIVIVIADHCSHGHIGCECIYSNQDCKIVQESAQQLMDQLKNYGDCLQSHNELDQTLKDPQLLDLTYNRWSEIADYLKNTPIIFVPANGEASLKTIQLIEKLHNYKYVQSYNVLKTHRWLYMLGCTKLRIIEKNSVEEFTTNLNQLVKEVIGQLTIQE